MKKNKVVSKLKWLQERKKFLSKEKKFTRERDRLNKERRMLPWLKVEKNYVFETEKGKETLEKLFEGKNQLAVYHFMFAPNWNAGCAHCSF